MYRCLIENDEVKVYKSVCPNVVQSMSTGKIVNVTKFMEKRFINNYEKALERCRTIRNTNRLI